MSAAALLIDLGSTYTKVRAIDLENPRILGAGQGPSTVTTDVTVGLAKALADLERGMGERREFTYRLASSSAAGGLRMVTVGLVRELTAAAARQAALGAGARLVGTFAYKLTSADVARIADLAPDIVLLAGGTDGGNEDVILHNAASLAACSVTCPVVVAGNRQAADEAAARLDAGGSPVTVTENVMPEFGVLDIEPTRAAIRRIFIDRIVHAKGIDRAAEMLDRVLMPTPAAVLDGARLLADGCGARPGLGSLLVVDVGGATTDVHSVAAGGPTRAEVVYRGLPEPYLKRTVEGDLGMRHNARSIVQAAGREALADDAGLAPERIEALARLASEDVGRLPRSEEERAFDKALARAAVRLAVKRHAGTLDTVHTATGPVTVQYGKDLSAVETILGTGGALVHGPQPAAILETALADDADPFSLRPRTPRMVLDSDYILFACGLLGTVEPDAALTLGLAHMHPVADGPENGCSSAA